MLDVVVGENYPHHISIFILTSGKKMTSFIFLYDFSFLDVAAILNGVYSKSQSFVNVCPVIPSREFHYNFANATDTQTHTHTQAKSVTPLENRAQLMK